MIKLHTPKVEDLWFRETLLSDPQTMSYNHAYGGTIPFPKEKWERWYDRWLRNCGNERFYRYIKNGDTFVGEVAYHLDDERKIYVTDVIVYAPYRGRGKPLCSFFVMLQKSMEFKRSTTILPQTTHPSPYF